MQKKQSIKYDIDYKKINIFYFFQTDTFTLKQSRCLKKFIYSTAKKCLFYSLFIDISIEADTEMYTFADDMIKLFIHKNIENKKITESF